ncbi:hypothetical protein ALC56_06618, partial [Trachymyrmex septentrionalis]
KKKKKRLHLAKKKVLFHQDNAQIHMCPAPMKRFTTREQLIAETEAYFKGLDKSYCSDGLKKLDNHWIKCIELKGEYVEK